MGIPVRLSLALLLLAPLAHADTIVSRTGGSFAGILGNNPSAATWTQTSAYSNVSISADLSSLEPTGNGTGTVYLTNRVGPGTTSANQIASTVVSGVPVDDLTPISLFSGLQLGAGTYYLVVADNLGIAGLTYDLLSNNIASTGPGDSINTDVVSFGAVAAYPPATVLTPLQQGNGSFDFQVTGTPGVQPVVTPEPSSFILFATGLLGAAGGARRRFSAR